MTILGPKGGGQGSENMENRVPEGEWQPKCTKKGPERGKKKSLGSMSGTHISRKKGARRAQDGAQNGSQNLLKNESRTAPNLGNLFKNESRTAPNLGKCTKKRPREEKKIARHGCHLFMEICFFAKKGMAALSSE